MGRMDNSAEFNYQQLGFMEHTRKQTNLPKLKLTSRLYLVLALLIALLLFGNALKHGDISMLPDAARYSILAVVTALFIYCCFPFVNKIAGERDKKKIGVAVMTLAVMVLAYLQSVREFFNAGTLNSLTEFSSLLLVFISGGYFLEIKSIENSFLLNNQKTQIDNILASLDEVIWSVNSTTLEMLYTNAACYKVWGYTPAEMMENKNTFLDAIHPEDKSRFYESAHNVVVSGSATCECRIFHKDKSIRYLRLEARLQKSVDGKTDVISGITIDVTKQKVAEIDANRTARELDNILNSISDGFFAINKDYVITYVNSEFRELYGSRLKVFIGTAYKDIASRELQKVFYRNCNKAMRENMNVGFEEYCAVLNKWFYYKIYPTDSGAAVYITDITDQKEMFRQIMSEKMKLEVQNQKLSEIAWIQSHKVRSPLANIMGLVPLLDFNNPGNPDNIDILNGIKAASERLDDVIHDITDRINSGDVRQQYLQHYKNISVQ